MNGEIHVINTPTGLLDVMAIPWIGYGDGFTIPSIPSIPDMGNVNVEDYDAHIHAERIRQMKIRREADMVMIEALQRNHYRCKLLPEIRSVVPKYHHLRKYMAAPLARCRLCQVDGPEHTRWDFPREHAYLHIGPIRATYIHSILFMIESGDWAGYEELYGDVMCDD